MQNGNQGKNAGNMGSDIARRQEQTQADGQKAGISQKDRSMAAFCVKCAVCSRAREKQRGMAYWFVRKIEGDLCPFCQAYERVYGRKAHEPVR